MTILSGKDVNNRLVPLLLDASGKILLYGTIPVQLQTGSNVVGKVQLDAGQSVGIGYVNAGVVIDYQPDSNGYLWTHDYILEGNKHGYAGYDLTIEGHKNNKIAAYESSVLQGVLLNPLVAGNNTVLSTAVPANKIWHITGYTAVYGGNVVGVSMYLGIQRGGNNYFFNSVPVIVSQVYNGFNVDLVLIAGDYIVLYISGGHAGDYAVLELTGYAQDDT